AADVDPDVIRYHRYAQALMADQMAGLPLDRTEGRGLVLDIPLGVHPDGYDVWRERTAFVLEANAGAPPDSFFTGGQDWGTPAPARDHARVSGYRTMRERLRFAMRHAALVRVDH